MKTISVLSVSLLLLMICAAEVRAIDAGNIEIHGFVSQGYLLTDKNNYMADTEEGTFQFNEMGVNFSTDLGEQLHLSIQLFSRDLGDVANNDVVLGYAYGDYRWKNWLGIRAGKIKIDYGLYNETREMDMLRTAVMLPQSVYSEIWRDSFSNISGAGIYGYVPAGVVGKFAYNFQIGAMEFDENGGFAKSFSPRIDETLSLTNMDADYAWFGTLQWQPPVPGLKIKATDYTISGLSAQGNVTAISRNGETISSSATFDVTQKDGYVLSLEYSWKNLVLTAEYSEDDYKINQSVDHAAASTPAVPSSDSDSADGGNGEGIPFSAQAPPKYSSQGWYVAAAYRFANWLETALSYSEYYPNKDDKNGDRKPDNSKFNSWLKTTTLSTRFDINENWVFKLEGSYNDGFGGINLAETPTNELSQYWWLFAAKMTFSF